MWAAEMLNLPPHSGADQIFEIKDEMTCISKNMVYCITCAGCNKYYIGQTGDCLRNSHGTQATDKPSRAKSN